MKTKFYFSLLVTFFTGFSIVHAQTICSGESVRFRETFGTGTSVAALPAGRTTYSYNSSSALADGDYKLATTTQGRPEWHNATDHTGDVHGRVMVINASYTAGEFYKDTVQNLVPGSYYSVSVQIMNVNKLGTCGTGAILPKLQFVVEFLAANNTFQSLTTFSSNFIPQSAEPTWVKLSSGFMMPAGITSVRYRILNNSQGGCGNDLAIDDITFSQCASLSSLPVKGLKINTVEQAANGVKILFSTESEFNTAWMETQKSVDGVKWQTVHMQPAAGNSDAHQAYTALDASPADQSVYYRIRQSDLDSSYTFSTIVRFAPGASASSAVSVYPNPFSSALSVNINCQRAEDYTVTVYSVAGMQVQKIIVNAKKGINMVALNMPAVAKGTYVVSVVNTDGSIRFTQKAVKN